MSTPEPAAEPAQRPADDGAAPASMPELPALHDAPDDPDAVGDFTDWPAGVDVTFDEEQDEDSDDDEGPAA